MMTRVTIPKLGLTMEEAIIEGWRKSVGEYVTAGEPLLDITTDKVTVEMEAPAAGYLRAMYADPGAAVPVGELIAVITETLDEPMD